MGETAITERQQYWLDHILAAESFNGTLVEYAGVEGLKVKDLYQWKTLLSRRGVITGKGAQQKAFVAVRESTTASMAALLLPNGIRIELSGAVDTETIQSLVTAASSFGSSAPG